MDTRIDKRGYEVLRKSDRRGHLIYMHVLIAESFFKGNLPEKNEIHHLDENKTNNTYWNLMVCSRKQHRIAHRRIRALRACGNPDWLVCAVCAKYDDPKNLYISKCRTVFRHVECYRKRSLELRESRQVFKRSSEARMKISNSLRGIKNERSKHE